MTILCRMPLVAAPAVAKINSPSIQLPLLPVPKGDRAYIPAIVALKGEAPLSLLEKRSIGEKPPAVVSSLYNIKPGFVGPVVPLSEMVINAPKSSVL
jgi:hypothetical protein